MGVERIWITRGDNVFDYTGEKSDKMLILQIDGGIYFTDFSGTTEQACDYLNDLAKHILATVDRGVLWWGNVADARANGSVLLDKRVTVTKHHHDDIFNKKPFCNFVENNGGTRWHSIDDLLYILNKGVN